MTRGAEPAGDPVARLAYPKRMGQAFVQLLETLDPTRLPIHGGDATTLVVTIDLDALKADLATADLIGAGLVPGDDLTGDRITAAQARRLACTAKILPVVLGGDSLPLDLGRTRRLYTPAQRKALLIRDRTCRGEGCDVPGTWCEAHHLRPLAHRRPDRPRRRRPLLQPPPPSGPRTTMAPRTTGQRRLPLPPTQIGGDTEQVLSARRPLRHLGTIDAARRSALSVT